MVPGFSELALGATDGLTGLFNRRGLEVAVRRAVADHASQGNVYVAAIIDLDKFKAYNDAHGHFKG